MSSLMLVEYVCTQVLTFKKSKHLMPLPLNATYIYIQSFLANLQYITNTIKIIT